MKQKRFLPLFFALFLCFLFWLSPGAAAQETNREEELLEKSGANEMYESLDEETKELLSRTGIQGAGEKGEGESWFTVLSGLLREKLSEPLRALMALFAVIILCRLANCFDSAEISSAAGFAGALACAVITVTPLLELMENAKRAIEGASVFLLASVPVYSGLMAASGSAAAGTSYSFLTLAAGNAIPLLSMTLVFPLLHAVLAFSLMSSVSQIKLDRVLASVYGFSKWLLVLAVTVFSGVLSVQTALNAQVDAASNKAMKLLASSAIPIVGGAFGDAVAAIQNSVHIVKSGVGAFGILAALGIFAPAAIEAGAWIGVCSLGQIAGDLFEMPKLSSFLGMCASVARMILAVIASVCAVSVVSAAIVLFVKGSL